MKLRAVVFDLWGTLTDSFHSVGYDRFLERMARMTGAPLGEFRDAWRVEYRRRASGEHPTLEASLSAILTSLEIAHEPTQLTDASEEWVRFTRQTLVPRRGALETLNVLRESGLKLGLVSDSTHTVPLVWDETPFADLIESPVFSCEAGTTKPDPALYLTACKGLGVPPRRCLYVGDGHGDELSGAAFVGMHPVLIVSPKEVTDRPGWQEAREWKGPVIRELAEVPPLVE